MKKCTKCKIEKEITEFSKQKESKDGLRGACKPCIKEYQAKYRKENKEYIKERYELNKEKYLSKQKLYYINNTEKIKESQAQWRSSNKDKIKEYSKKYNITNKNRIKSYQLINKEHISEYRKEYRKTNKKKLVAYRLFNKEKNKLYQKQRRHTEPLFKLKGNLRNRTSKAFKNKGYNKNSDTQDILGVEWEVCRIHIEKQFTKGMGWDNYGDWHIDHTVPLASASTEEELITLCNYLNLQPLWAKDNIEKSAKYNEIDKVNMIKKIKDSLIQKVSQVIEK
jgi:hypothetical protein